LHSKPQNNESLFHKNLKKNHPRENRKRGQPVFCKKKPVSKFNTDLLKILQKTQVQASLLGGNISSLNDLKGQLRREYFSKADLIKPAFCFLDLSGKIRNIALLKIKRFSKL